jgi:hypothetical protein
MNIRIASIGFLSSAITDKVTISVTLLNSDRTATFKVLADFGTPHSGGSVDNIRMGKGLRLGVDANDVKFIPYDDDGYPTVLLKFPITAFFHSDVNAPSVWSKGFGVAEKSCVKMTSTPKGTNLYVADYEVNLLVPFAVYAYLDGKLQHLHEDELDES